MTTTRTIGLAVCVAWSAAGVALAGDAEVIAAEAVANDDGSFRISATVRHADEGWHHYADAFVVTAPDGTVLGTRELAHPHVEEQPFTRSLGRVEVPEDLTHVLVRAVDSVHGEGTEAFRLAVPGR